ncbi:MULTISPECIES: bifunctional DNA-formamidopyrimidine glycosylase/DNA-(apurinic or apyrimidinic site) lyase [Rhodanobacter]|uniref:bifunctional DNA-formamidopyrimidine glycosylase/DNA-(apurinic or apyrimidinic site) lyase n=1 Tax=Rhodanobacter TaxID=75309 RepID=UPI0003FD0146|nr:MULTISPECIES: bifunctional DNA-formamidopyrimidine glycosylase/DNA-(apurinic or apyrimidinic site) lyase [Rhodanobacter]KZC19422.1 DNA-formamidopyrimidine glycosylase [Rhodanobacter denitrificans]UJJ50705.1 bifunctional DNA-formamidopyrimidine glycosylase/DNA-(apurinic or apyrimidinic site) lyase [Rhodanobacter denitrificans]UJM93419.1 bifunctional DNA-formamidopyrimidine glycosylase/DNA-(apurinic or apyrimidinic site) lyase [Rhodanobacter denitrificans]UJM96951.1 bifunctional DNA-formamidop
MPELPEVETTRRGIAPYVVGRRVTGVILRRPDLRWPIPPEIGALLPGQRIDAVERRAKYLLLHTAAGSVLLHLGMTGVLRVLPPDAPVGRHDHVDIALERTSTQAPRILRFTDPRRFGCLLWQPPDTIHELLAKLGPEPLTDAFDGDLLWHRSRGRTAAVKLFLMDNAVVVGVGNIYASEALFRGGIDPRKPAGSLSRARYARLAAEVKHLLAWAIERGGTTLRDFLAPDGAPGYFFRELMVYGRAGEPCHVCGTAIRQVVLGQRSTFWCPRCQR